MEYEWNNSRYNRGRRPYLLLINSREDRGVVFDGQSIPGCVAVLHTKYRKNGKWSNTTYSLRIADARGWQPFDFVEGWETRGMINGLEEAARDRLTATDGKILSWSDMAVALGLSVAAVRRWVPSWAPCTAKELDDREAQLRELDHPPGEILGGEEAMVVNLTLHALMLRRQDGEMMTLPPGESVARVASTDEVVGTVGGLAVHRMRFGGQVEGLPDPRPGVVYVASLLAAQAAQAQSRHDVYAPGPAIRDAEGRVIGADGLSAV